MQFHTRRAKRSDVDGMAEAHRDSIRSIGARCYPKAIVDDWSEGVTAGLYRRAMTRGDVFFVAVGEIDGRPAVLGFASDYPVEHGTHGVSAYVRGAASRSGVGSALLRLAEAHAVERGATSLRIEASLSGVDFYKAHGFVETGTGEIRLRTGRPIACVFMRKDLAKRERTAV